MKKFTMLLSVLALAFFASACSESPMAVQTDGPLTSAEAYSWTKPTTTTTTTTTKTSKTDPTRKATSGYALGM